MNNTNQTDATVLTTVQQAIAAAQAGNKPLARLHLEQAVTSEHKNPDYWVWIAWTAESPVSAISALQHALSLDPDHALAVNGLAWAEAMRDFDLGTYSKPIAEEPQTESSLRIERQLSADTSDEGFDTEALETPQDVAMAVAEVDAELFVEETEPVASHDVQELQPIDEPVAEIEGVDDPVILEPLDELEADIATYEESLTEPADDHDEADDVTNQQTERKTEPLEAEMVDVDNIDTEDLVVPVDDPGQEVGAEGPITILAVDDSPTIRKIVSMSLEGVGYNVVTAADGMEAMQQLPKCNPSLILTDISMPKIDGYQLCKLIKAHEKTKAIPVIMLSGKDGVFDKIKGKFVGCDDYITKPFQSADLLAKVSSYLPAPVSDS